MQIIFVGGLFPPERREEFIGLSKEIIQFAADGFQWSFIKGLDRYYNNLSIFTSPLLGNFPKSSKRLFLNNSEFSHKKGNRDFCVGYIMFPILSLISRSINLYRSLLRNALAKDAYLLVYCVHTPYILAAVRYKKKYPGSRICLIVPDLPQYMSSNTGKFYTMLKNIDLKIIRRLVNSIDSFVFITDQMASQFDTKGKPWVRIEGMFDQDLVPKQLTSDTSGYKIILYTGTLDSRYGIVDLLEAFKLIQDTDYSLWICGEGNMKKTIVEYSKSDQRIKYFGQLSREVILNLQQKVTVLVNPRTSEGDYTKYSFPIKTMEYLVSGKPCIMHRLPGIPDEYTEHIFIPDEETAFSLSRKIIEVCNMPADIIEEKCRKSKSFILNTKTPYTQVLKLVTLLNGK